MIRRQNEICVVIAVAENKSVSSSFLRRQESRNLDPGSSPG